MDLKFLVIGMMFMVAAGAVTLTMMFDMYGPNGYNVNLSADPDTATLQDLQDKLAEAQNDTTVVNQDIFNKSAGQSGSSFASGQISQGDLMQNSISSLTNFGTYLDILIGIATLGLSMVGMSATGPVGWFLMGSLGITVALILIGMAFFKQLSG